jgi:hypothetical protein
MPTVDLTDEGHAAVTRAVRRSIADDKYPLSPTAGAAEIRAGEARSRVDTSITSGETAIT